MKFRCNVSAVFIAAIVFIAGCGGGGNAPDTSAGRISVNVNANEPKTFTLGDLEVTVTSDVDNTITFTRQHMGSGQRPPNQSVAEATGSLEVKAKNAASGSYTIRYPAMDGNLIATALLENGWVPLEAVLENGQFVVTLPAVPTPVVDSFRSPTSSLVVFVGNLLGQTPRESRLVHMAGGNDYRGSAIVVHGWCDSVKDFEPLANKLVSSGRYPAVFGFEYDWTKTIDNNGADLAKVLRHIESQVGPKQVELIAHSMGGLVSRHALEVEEATRAAKQLTTVCTPHEGTVMATVGTLTYYLAWAFLNSPTGWGYPLPSTPSIAQMVPNSAYLKDLNRQREHAGKVDYLFVSGYLDRVVDQISGYAGNTEIREETAGLFWRVREIADHSSLVKTSEGIDKLIDIIKQNQPDTTGVTFQVTTTSTEPYDDRYWRFAYKLLNGTDGPIQHINTQFFIYDAFGEPRGKWWFDPTTPNGEFFPTNYATWPAWIDSGESFPPFGGEQGILIATDLDRTPIAQAPLDRQVQTVIMYALLEKDGKPLMVEQRVLCTYNGRVPMIAKTRLAPGPQDPTAGGVMPYKP